MRLLLVTALLLGANAALADAPAPTKAADTPPLSVWRPAESDSYEHLQSGLTCPKAFSGYRRTQVVVFDKFGLDVGCNYSSQTAAITYYLTRRKGEGLDAGMAEAKRELLDLSGAMHPQLLSDSTYAQDGLNWRLALYAVDGGAHSGIWIADLYGWTFEFRATYPAADEPSVLTDLRVISASVQASAGARLGLCAKVPGVQRPGALVTDQEKVRSAAMMSGILAASLESASKDGKAVKAADAPVVWCVERAAEKDGHGLLFWRAVHADGTDGLQDQVSLVRQGPPVILSLAPDSLAALIEAEANKGKDASEHVAVSDPAAQWVASLRQNDRVAIFGYFTNRPPVDQALDLLAGVLSGRTRAAGGYSVNGKQITINVPDK